MATLRKAVARAIKNQFSKGTPKNKQKMKNKKSISMAAWHKTPRAVATYWK